MLFAASDTKQFLQRETNDMEKKKLSLHIWNFKWLILLDCVIVTGAVMAFGFITTLFLDLNEKNAIIMLYMVPSMTVAVTLSTFITFRTLRRRMEKLFYGMQSVADGELDVEIEIERADEYKDLYEGFNQMVRELRITKEEMQNFINEFSHEFKTPITSISGFAEYLASTGKEFESEERLKYLQIIRDEALRLSELSQNTLLLSKVEACQIITEKERFMLSEQIMDCVILLFPQIEKKKIELEVDLPELFYYGNEELMEQIWLNLLNNAVKYTPEHGTICVRGGETREEICVEICDNGEGMDEETIRHIFEKYYQNNVVRSVKGNGIGLSIVARIVTLCSGYVEVKSCVGEGSSFKVHLPV